MLLSIHPDNPQPRLIQQVAEVLRRGGVIIYPTDTLYGFGCDIHNAAAVERICALKGIRPKDARFSFVCASLSHMTDYTKSVDTPTFRLLKAALPGPYTFVLTASRAVPKILQNKRDTVGVRVPDHRITQALVEALGHPLMSVSLPHEDDEVEYYTDPYDIHERFGEVVDVVVEGGFGGTTPSTVIDLTSGTPELVREGAGPWENLVG